MCAASLSSLDRHTVTVKSQQTPKIRHGQGHVQRKPVESLTESEGFAANAANVISAGRLTRAPTPHQTPTQQL